jgi:hypothetical protein
MAGVTVAAVNNHDLEIKVVLVTAAGSSFLLQALNNRTMAKKERKKE